MRKKDRCQSAPDECRIRRRERGGEKERGGGEGPARKVARVSHVWGTNFFKPKITRSAEGQGHRRARSRGKMLRGRTCALSQALWKEARFVDHLLGPSGKRPFCEVGGRGGFVCRKERKGRIRESNLGKEIKRGKITNKKDTTASEKR